ncbi:Beta-glucan synthesis-associated protein KRE6 [Grifola frondosa]|uniref:Beta-glucan synthesis-associated protein KRE6 n=1 Tax=Grifola frondosa TaxID=5627 RepID=A0A1C7MJQ2_GRIFR|nr:Beta-glucan synthesis-associated protein KRE6 [Grifola frondosa]
MSGMSQPISFSDHHRQRFFGPSPSLPSTVTSTTNLLADRSPPLSTISSLNRINSFTSSPSLSAADSPYLGAGRPLSLGDEYYLPADPHSWGSNLSRELKEPDDDIHEPDFVGKGNLVERDGHVFSWRGITNLGSLVVLIVALLTLFAGYPLITHFTAPPLSTLGAFNLGGINASGQVPTIPGNRGLIDADTPRSAYTKTSWQDGSEFELVFSDEFNVDGRTFYPGDDPYWEAVDLHYWETNNLEWYDPAAITTQDGSLVITLEQKETHGLNYQGGMMSSWNKFCFTGGYVETNVSLPGVNNIVGLWPAMWTMGNLGEQATGRHSRAWCALTSLSFIILYSLPPYVFITSLTKWPYTYDAMRLAATINGDPGNGGVLSFLPGQKLSRCTCDGESHPGPKHSDGTYVGRSAPEIDIFEAQITGTPLTAQVSQSAQWAPFNHGYIWLNTSANEVIPNTSISMQNSYIGGVLQQATSVVTSTDQNCYEYDAGCYSIYAYEYQPGFDNANFGIVYYMDLQQRGFVDVECRGMAADALVDISARPVPQEPMVRRMSHHAPSSSSTHPAAVHHHEPRMSYNFGQVDLAHIPFPVHMRVDYVRVYQPADARNIGCDPAGFPTQAYINQFIEAYTDPNLTTWRNDFGQPFPRNSFLGQC